MTRWERIAAALTLALCLSLADRLVAMTKLAQQADAIARKANANTEMCLDGWKACEVGELICGSDTTP